MEIAHLKPRIIALAIPFLLIFLSVGKPVLSMAKSRTKASSPSGSDSRDKPGPQCTLTAVEKNQMQSRYDLRIGERLISILGWTHPDPSSDHKSHILELLDEATKDAEAKRCELVNSKIKDIWELTQPYFSPSLHAIEQLMTVDQKKKIRTIGVEFTSEEWIPEKAALDDIAGQLNRIARKCSNQEIGPILAKLFLTIPGPVYLFNAKNPKVHILPTEDKFTKDALRPIGQALTTLRSQYPLRITDLPKSAQLPFSKVMNLMLEGKLISHDDIEAVRGAMGQSPLTPVITNWAMLWKRLMDGQLQRNEVIAKSLLRSSGTAVLLIGNSHAEGIANILLQSCQPPEHRFQVEKSENAQNIYFQESQ